MAFLRIGLTPNDVLVELHGLEKQYKNMREGISILQSGDQCGLSQQQNETLEAMPQRISNVYGQLVGISSRLDNHDEELADLKLRSTSHDSQIATLQKDFAALSSSLGSAKSRCSRKVG